MHTEGGFPYLGGTVYPLYFFAKMSHNKSMKELTSTVRPSVSNLSSGSVVRAGYRRRYTTCIDSNRFVGFKVGDSFFSSLKLLKSHFGVRNLKDLELEVDRLELGSITAEWFNTEERYFWASYLWNGAFRVGSSADRLVLEVA